MKHLRIGQEISSFPNGLVDFQISPNPKGTKTSQDVRAFWEMEGWVWEQGGCRLGNFQEPFAKLRLDALAPRNSACMNMHVLWISTDTASRSESKCPGTLVETESMPPASCAA